MRKKSWAGKSDDFSTCWQFIWCAAMRTPGGIPRTRRSPRPTHVRWYRDSGPTRGGPVGFSKMGGVYDRGHGVPATAGKPPGGIASPPSRATREASSNLGNIREIGQGVEKDD